MNPTWIRRTVVVVSVVACALAAWGCNLSDQVKNYPTSGCQADSGCNDHGTCNVTNGLGTCECEAAYTGSRCRDCAEGYERVGIGECVLENPNNTNSNSNNNTTMECMADEVLIDETCVADTCTPNPCGAGTCTVTGDGTWECLCPDDTVGLDCPACDDGCAHGGCDANDICVCDRGWDGAACDVCALGFTGPNCDTCSATAFGPNCDTCASLTPNAPWWNPLYTNRQALIVYNPPNAVFNVLTGVAVEHTFNHQMIVANLLLDPGGADLRVVQGMNELNRVPAFDSGWNQSNTRIWFPTVGDIVPGRFQLYFLYMLNPNPGTAPENATQVLRQDRGWYHGPPGGVAYSADALFSGMYSVQVRQKDINVMQVYLHDASDDISALAQIRFVDGVTGQLIRQIDYPSGIGTRAIPGEDFTDTMGLPDNLRVEISMTSLDPMGIYVGGQLAQSGTAGITFSTTLVRARADSASAQVFTCPPEMMMP